MDSLGLLKTAASGMEAQRAALDIAARNVAAAEAAGPKGSFERLVPQFRLVEDDGTPEVAFTGAKPQGRSADGILSEMVGVLNASRAYEADASIFEIGKRLAERTITMGNV